MATFASYCNFPTCAFQALVVLSGISGCHSDPKSAGDATASIRRVCDGSDSIRFATWVSVSLSRVPTFEADQLELGREFIFVDGRCHYWVQSPGAMEPDDFLSPWRPYREGVLSDQDEQALHDLVSYDDLSRAPICITTTVSDGDPIAIWDGNTQHFCEGRLLNVSPDWPMRRHLFDAGIEMTGPLRLEVGQLPVVPGATVYEWPLDNPPSYYEIAYSLGMKAGQSRLIAETSEVATLRAFRRHILDDAMTRSAELFYQVVFVKPNGYAVTMRDDLPFTDSVTGLWSPP